MYESNDEMVSHPKHYIASNGWEVIDICEKLIDGCIGRLAFDLGNVIKYISRFKKKNGMQDLEKAKWYMIDIYNLEYERYKVAYTLHPDIFDLLPEFVEAVTEDLDDLETRFVSDIFTSIVNWRVGSSVMGVTLFIEKILLSLDYLIAYEEAKLRQADLIFKYCSDDAKAVKDAYNTLYKEDENDGK